MRMLTLREALPFIDELLPGVVTQLRGASAAEIEVLEQLAERSLAEPHRELLEIMGADSGPLLSALAAHDVRAETLSRYYEQIGWRPPRRYSLVARDPSLPHSLFLDSDSRPPFAVVGFDLPLVHADRRGVAPWAKAQVFASSLTELVVRGAFEVFGWRNFELEGYATITAQPELLARVDAQLRALGYVQHPLSGGYTGMYGHEGVATILTTRNDPHDIGLLYMFTNDRAEVERVIQALSFVVEIELHWLEDPVAKRPYVAALR